MISFFTDPVLRAPTLGCMLMCVAAALMGVIVYLRRQSLVGEVLSHASYPGVIFALLTASAFSVSSDDEATLSLMILTGALVFALLGYWAVNLLTVKLRISDDAALCFVLSTFFGVGLMVASEVQVSNTSLYKQTLNYLFGQAATMTDVHIAIYGILALIIVSAVCFFFKELQVIAFDRSYAMGLGIAVKAIDTLFFFLIALSVIIGIRSVGVALMSAMLIAPSVAARQWTNRLSMFFALSALFAALSGFLGNYFSVELTRYFQESTSVRLVLPTGPMIVCVAAVICACSLLFAPKRGVIVRGWRIFSFRAKTNSENILKAIWRKGEGGKVSRSELAKQQALSPLFLYCLLFLLRQSGWVKKSENHYCLTTDGWARAEKIIRLHRLWELYLTRCLGVGHELVHRNAEEMEHILTGDLEKKLTEILNDPQHDPHQQPIPPSGALYDGR